MGPIVGRGSPTGEKETIRWESIPEAKFLAYPRLPITADRLRRLLAKARRIGGGRLRIPDTTDATWDRDLETTLRTSWPLPLGLIDDVYVGLGGTPSFGCGGWHEEQQVSVALDSQQSSDQAIVKLVTMRKDPSGWDPSLPGSDQIFQSLCRAVVDEFDAEFGFGGEYVSLMRPGIRDARAWAWDLTYFGPSEVRRLGRDRLAQAPFHQIEWTEAGGAWTRLSRNPLWPSLEKEARRREVAAHLRADTPTASSAMRWTPVEGRPEIPPYRYILFARRQPSGELLQLAGHAFDGTTLGKKYPPVVVASEDLRRRVLSGHDVGIPLLARHVTLHFPSLLEAKPNDPRAAFPRHGPPGTIPVEMILEMPRSTFFWGYEAHQSLLSAVQNLCDVFGASFWLADDEPDLYFPGLHDARAWMWAETYYDPRMVDEIGRDVLQAAPVTPRFDGDGGARIQLRSTCYYRDPCKEAYRSTMIRHLGLWQLYGKGERPPLAQTWWPDDRTIQPERVVPGPAPSARR